MPGRVENDVIEIEPIFVRGRDRLVRTQGMPHRTELYDRVGIDVHSLLSTGS